ncbi:MAG TPA: pyridoxamine 5'-phosphate oxidase [Ignavibacteria bacterium]|nr:pyridoxamine 5'-phosphate oxidase [Ignavibacteria bacterium]
MDDKEIQSLRRQYSRSTLSASSVSKDPFKQFEKWFQDVLNSGFLEPNAMTLATASKSGKPSARVVLLKGIHDSGFVFYTNYKSRKGKDIEENPYGCLLFFWDKLERQIRIEGKIEKVSQKESEEYFNTRPYKSRVGAWASKQSSVIESRSVIVKEFLKYMMKFKTHVPLPDVWGGYRLLPDTFEFWQGRPNRLHDRVRYSKVKSGWKIERLAP